jgi:hypothetical protein
MQQRFFCTIPAPALAMSQMPPVQEKGRFLSAVHLLTGVISKCDDVHRHFRLDFRGANAHCDLVQRNNVT